MRTVDQLVHSRMHALCQLGPVRDPAAKLMQEFTKGIALLHFHRWRGRGGGGAVAPVPRM